MYVHHKTYGDKWSCPGLLDGFLSIQSGRTIPLKTAKSGEDFSSFWVIFAERDFKVRKSTSRNVTKFPLKSYGTQTFYKMELKGKTLESLHIVLL
jgi:hypothetical protein